MGSSRPPRLGRSQNSWRLDALHSGERGRDGCRAARAAPGHPLAGHRPRGRSGVARGRSRGGRRGRDLGRRSRMPQDSARRRRSTAGRATTTRSRRGTEASRKRKRDRPSSAPTDLPGALGLRGGAKASASPAGDLPAGQPRAARGAHRRAAPTGGSTSGCSLPEAEACDAVVGEASTPDPPQVPGRRRDGSARLAGRGRVAPRASATPPAEMATHSQPGPPSPNSSNDTRNPAASVSRRRRRSRRRDRPPTGPRRMPRS